MKPTIPQVVERFAAYYKKNPVWGSLHIVLDDGNYESNHVKFCVEYAKMTGDVEGESLANILLEMSSTQRLKLPSCVQKYLEEK